MHILLTNDDGIYSPGIFAIHQELTKIAKVTVVSPDSERSSVGHAITLSHPILFKKVNRRGKFFGYGISGTPADCVKFGLKIILKQKPDLVVSGINLGQNEGCSVHYSGTVAGAREGCLMGIPSIAFSLATFVDPDFSYAAKVAAKITKVAAKRTIPKGTFLNVNIPHKKAKQIKGLVFTKQGTVPIHGDFQKRQDPNYRTYYWMTGRMPSQKNNNLVDTYALRNDYVTVTPIKCDSTDKEFLKELSSWKINL